MERKLLLEKILNMNWTIENIEDKNFVKVIADGAFDADAHLEMLKDLVARRFWKPGTAVLIDFRGVETAGVSLEDIRQASGNRQQIDDRLGDGKSAYLMKSLADFARGRQFQLLTEDKVASALCIFMDEDKALNWLQN